MQVSDPISSITVIVQPQKGVSIKYHPLMPLIVVNKISVNSLVMVFYDDSGPNKINYVCLSLRIFLFTIVIALR